MERCRSWTIGSLYLLLCQRTKVISEAKSSFVLEPDIHPLPGKGFGKLFSETKENILKILKQKKAVHLNGILANFLKFQIGRNLDLFPYTKGDVLKY